MTRFYLGQCEYKWAHANTRVEHMWIMREVGAELYKHVEANNWEWQLIRTSSTALPGDIYCRCDIYVDIHDSPRATLFALKYSNAIQVEKVI